MLVLTIDTSTPAVTAGLVRLPPAGPPERIAARVTVDARAHAEVLTPQIQECLAEAHATPADLDAVVVGCGPGPFTGLRVGMVTAAAFGDALGISVYGVCSLDAIAAEAATAGAAGALSAGAPPAGALSPDAPSPDGGFLVVTDARRREVYWARYTGMASPTRVEGPAVSKPSDLDVGHTRAAAGSPEHVAQLGLAALAPASPSPYGLAVAAAGDLRTGAAPAPLEPLYLRRPDAAEPKPRVLASRITA